MELNDRDRRLVMAIQHGLPLCPRPYASIGERIDMSEAEVIRRFHSLLARGLIKRLGVIVRHHELGYRANAMVVWDVPNNRVADLGRAASRFDFVTLCYRRSRRADWPYNLYCMIHGRDRETVLQNIARLIAGCDMSAYSHQVLFSRRRFKQRGAQYLTPNTQTVRTNISTQLVASC